MSKLEELTTCSKESISETMDTCGGNSLVSIGVEIGTLNFEVCKDVIRDIDSTGSIEIEEGKLESIMNWFKKKGINEGRPEELI